MKQQTMVEIYIYLYVYVYIGIYRTTWNKGLRQTVSLLEMFLMKSLLEISKYLNMDVFLCVLPCLDVM